MNDPWVSELLDRHTPENGQSDTDWDDVLRRAGADPGRVPNRRRRSLLALAAAAVLLVVLFATPAFGLRQAVLNLVGREDVEFEESEPAPLVAKRDFADLALGAPPSMAPQALPEETRRIVFDTGQRKRVLFVAPTRKGGFCYLIEGSGGGCQRNEGAADRTPPLTTGYMAGSEAGGPMRVSRVSGTVLDPRTASVTVEFADEHEVDLRFLWIGEPILAGFFEYDVPRDRQLQERGPVAVVSRAADGTVIHREASIRYDAPDRVTRPRVASPTNGGQALPSSPPVAPTEPILRATHRGARVTSGANGATLFDSSGLDPEIRHLLEGRGAGFGCFRIVTQYGATYPRGYSVGGRFADRVGVRFNDLGPLDACEIQGSYGHRWPDRLGGHSAVELPFTEKGRRWFTDRAAARDLALFVRGKELQQIRKLTGDDLVRELTDRFGTRITRLESETARPPAGTIGYWTSGERTVFSRVSETSKRFFVMVEKGKLVRNNLGELAMVF